MTMGAQGPRGPRVPDLVPDLGALRDQRRGAVTDGSAEGLAFYANDVQPGVESEGNLSLTFRYHGPEGASQPVRITLPAGLLVELLSMAPEVVEASVQRYAKQAQNLGRWLGGVKGAARSEAEAHRAARPTQLRPEDAS